VRLSRTGRGSDMTAGKKITRCASRGEQMMEKRKLERRHNKTSYGIN